DLLVQDSEEQIIELSNGCVCCTVRGDLVRTLGDLAERRARGQLAFDRVIIETTGMANPGPVCQTFFMDDEIAETFRLDAVITVVDACHGALLQRLAAVRGRLSLCADQAAAAKWWLSMPMASVSAEGPMPKALSTRRTSPLMPGCRHQGR